MPMANVESQAWHAPMTSWRTYRPAGPRVEVYEKTDATTDIATDALSPPGALPSRVYRFG
jgi:hypothetical protein